MSKPIKTTGQKARSYVQSGLSFTNSNGQLYGHWVTPTKYVVFSYGPHWPLFVWCTSTRTWYENEDRASVTTSKHRSLTHPLVPTELRSCQWMKDFLK